MKKSLLFALFITVQVFAQTPSFEWGKHLGGLNDIKVWDNAFDSSGNVYLVGEFVGTIDFDPDATGVENRTAAGQNDAFVLKLNAQGNFIWVKTFGGTGMDLISRVVVDDFQNVYVGGRYQSASISFAPVGTATNSGDYDGFLLKMDTTGTPVWYKRVASASTDFFVGLDVDSNGNVYATASYKGGVAELGPGTVSNYGNAAQGFYDFLLMKLSSTGATLWAYKFGDNSNDIGYSVTLSDDETKVAVTGYFRGIIDFDTAGASIYNLSSVGNADSGLLYVVDSSAGFIFAKAFGNSTAACASYDAAFDSANNIYVTGRFAGTSANFSPGVIANSNGGSGFDAFVAKYDIAGNYQWVKSFQGVGSGTNEQGSGIDVDNLGNIYVIGTYNSFGGLDLDPSANSVNVPNYGSTAGTSDIFLARLDANGDYSWGASFTNSNNNDDAWGVHVDDNYNILIAGHFTATQFDLNPLPYAGDQLVMGNVNGSSDVFITKLAQPTLSTASFDTTASFVLYPNPVKNNLTIESVEALDEVTIYTLTGQIIVAPQVNNTIDMSELPKGYYFVKATTVTGKIMASKVMKE
ncbi:T9SS type A sorting domain-containing protein [Flavobacterium sp. NRK F7]|uniref:T9SS type A sorting domain-containing protein n=1 Tax=Flavobacterium sp. NRK F7 TaxID=2954930 RepID=UPI0020909766|nr:T9SS type A sorting domain-containing protein [Flavobacterium sp. NRK F7]MCO6164406.1 T9SS type A sorting domain-containing protein [Flavobacterium sp. NRK F7]